MSKNFFIDTLLNSNHDNKKPSLLYMNSYLNEQSFNSDSLNCPTTSDSDEDDNYLS
ncbi:unnamed protein product, partial [Rotaria magnacalcarata]